MELLSRSEFRCAERTEEKKPNIWDRSPAVNTRDCGLAVEKLWKTPGCNKNSPSLRGKSGGKGPQKNLGNGSRARNRPSVFMGPVAEASWLFPKAQVGYGTPNTPEEVSPLTAAKCGGGGFDLWIARIRSRNLLRGRGGAGLPWPSHRGTESRDPCQISLWRNAGQKSGELRGGESSLPCSQWGQVDERRAIA